MPSSNSRKLRTLESERAVGIAKTFILDPNVPDAIHGHRGRIKDTVGDGSGRILNAADVLGNAASRAAIALGAVIPSRASAFCKKTLVRCRARRSERKWRGFHGRIPKDAGNSVLPKVDDHP